MPKKWLSPKPLACQTCGIVFKTGDIFIDGRTSMGPWALMCRQCHLDIGTGIGTGNAQQYDWDTCRQLKWG